MARLAQITCEFSFEASHVLYRPEWSIEENEAVFGNCARLHGHSYRLLVTLRGPIDPDTGMVRNFREVKRLVRERVIDRVDHHHLNEIIPEISTAENITYWIAQQLLPAFGTDLYRLELWETRTAFTTLSETELAELRAQASVPLTP